MRAAENTLSPWAYDLVTDPEEIARLVCPSGYFKGDFSRVIELISETGALLRGHFQLLSGQHSRYFFRFRNIASNSVFTDTAAGLVIESAGFNDLGGRKILCPDTAGSSLAHAVARKLGVGEERVIVAKTDRHNRPTSFVNFGEIQAGDDLIIVNDLTTTGQGVNSLIHLAAKSGASVSAVSLFGTRHRDTPTLFPKEIDLSYVVMLMLEQDTCGERSEVVVNHVKTVENCELCKSGNVAIASWELNY